jgi:two-component system, NtrC family, response regulator HydG
MEKPDTPQGRILTVTSNENLERSLSEILSRRGFLMETVATGGEGLKNAGSRLFDLMLLDLRLSDISPLELLSRVKEASPQTPVFIVATAPTVDSAVEALRRGAYDYLIWPLPEEELHRRVEAALQVRRLGEVRRRTAEELQHEKVRNIELRRDLQARYGFSAILGKSPKMKQIHDLVLEITRSDSTVLIQGESGTGKGLIARIIHYNSQRCDRPFVEANCAIYSEGVLQSELFGHEKGAFTGAVKQKRGRFELADSGTIFLDEIAELPHSTQLMLLRFLQERKFERVGGEETLQVDARVIAATNKNLTQSMEQGSFRNDLYYRLNVIPLFIPPLRERSEDIPLLATRFLEECARKVGKTFQGFSDEALQTLLDYSYPGNVRELENAVERSVVLAKGDLITLADLPSTLKETREERGDMKLSLYENERLYILKTLAECNWNKKLTASVLGINRSSLYSKLKKYGIGAESAN